MRSLFICDSLGLPRPDNNPEYEGTVSHYLAEKGHIWILGHTGVRITDLEEMMIGLHELLPDGFFDLVVIQLGLSDCAPRPLAMHWRNTLSKVKPLPFKRFIIRLIHNHRPFIQKHFGYYQRTPYHKFINSLSTILKITSVKASRTIVILTPPVRDCVEAHSPGIRKEIGIYGEGMKKIAQFFNLGVIDVNDELSKHPELYMTIDGHLTKKGQKVIIEALELNL